MTIGFPAFLYFEEEYLTIDNSYLFDYFWNLKLVNQSTSNTFDVPKCIRGMFDVRGYVL